VNRPAGPRESPPSARPFTSELRLPNPCLVVLVGAAGSGKSTLAGRLFDSDAILSSDAYREIVAGDASDQGATRTAFAILHRQLDRRLADRRTTVVDATNVTAYARRGLLRRAVAHGIPSVGLVLDLDSKLVLAQNATRSGRIVPAPIVERQLGELARSLRRGSFEGEGFAAVHVVRTRAELEDLTVAWDPPP
jgi:protein phosphatase